MGILIGPIDLASWRTMLMLKQDNRGMQDINTDGKYSLAIKKNTEVLSLFMKEIYENVA